MIIIDVIKGVMSWQLFFALVGMICFLYIAIIGPAIFNIWVMPDIEKRYNKKLSFDNYFTPFPRWGMSVLILPTYIVLNLLGWGKVLRGTNPLGGIGFDVKTATRFEVFMSIFSVCMLLTLVLASIGFGIVSD